MELNSLTAISPVDGRYRHKVEELAAYFSEFGLIRYRLLVEIEYFIALCELPLPQLSEFEKSGYDKLRSIYHDFSLTDAKKIKELEKTTNHDVKALEYFIKEKFSGSGLDKWKEFIHFGLTSQDINNTATPLSLREAMSDICMPAIYELRESLASLSDEWKDIPMLARTHGQPASPTRLVNPSRRRPPKMARSPRAFSLQVCSFWPLRKWLPWWNVTGCMLKVMIEEKG